MLTVKFYRSRRNRRSEQFILVCVILTLLALCVTDIRNEVIETVQEDKYNQDKIFKKGKSCDSCEIKHVLHIIDDNSAGEPIENIELIYDETNLDGSSLTKEEDKRDYLETPLHRAVINNEELLLSFIDQNYYAINKRDVSGKTPLFIAVETGQTDSVETLLSMGADPSITDFKKRTVLHVAAEAGDDYTLEKLVGYKQLLDLHDRDGATPTWYAASSDSWSALAILVRSGAKIYPQIFDLPDLNELFHDDIDIKEAFIKNVSNLDAALLLSCIKGYEDLVSFILDCGADPNSEKLGNSLCWNLLTRDKFDILDLLLTNGLNIETPDRYGHTVLHLAAIAGDNVDAVQYLLDRNIDVNIKAGNGLTALDLASGKIWRLLRNNGAKTSKELKNDF